jgi:hypothetical protein
MHCDKECFTISLLCKLQNLDMQYYCDGLVQKIKETTKHCHDNYLRIYIYI